MILSTLIAITLFAVPQPQEPAQPIEQPTCIIDRLEDNDMAVLEVVLDEVAYYVNVPRQDIAYEVYDDMELSVEIINGYVVLNNVKEADFDVYGVSDQNA